MECRVCCAAEAVAILRTSEMQGAVRAGFNPFREKGLVSDYIIGLMEPGYASRWARSVMESRDTQEEWPVCEKCRTRIADYLARMTGGDLGSRTDGDVRRSGG